VHKALKMLAIVAI